FRSTVSFCKRGREFAIRYYPPLHSQKLAPKRSCKNGSRLRGGRLFHPSRQLATQDTHIAWGFDTQADPISDHLDDCNCDSAIDDDLLPWLPAKNQHLIPP